jgi:hypothetical protein
MNVTNFCTKHWTYHDSDIKACPYCEIDRYREALHHISLASQNSQSSKSECGKIARKALEKV